MASKYRLVEQKGFFSVSVKVDKGSEEASDVNARLVKLEEQQANLLKTLEEERKASAGKDKKSILTAMKVDRKSCWSGQKSLPDTGR